MRFLSPAIAALLGLSLGYFMGSPGVAPVAEVPCAVPSPASSSRPGERSDDPTVVREAPVGQLAELQKQVAALKVQLAFANGQLTAVEGKPVAWPEALAASLTPEGYPKIARKAAEALPGSRLEKVDCEEFPCVAYFRMEHPTEDWEKVLSEAMRAGGGGDVGVTQFGSTTDAGGFSAIALVPQSAEPAVQPRIRTRVDPEMAAWMEEEK